MGMTVHVLEGPCPLEWNKYDPWIKNNNSLSTEILLSLESYSGSLALLHSVQGDAYSNPYFKPLKCSSHNI